MFLLAALAIEGKADADVDADEVKLAFFGSSAFVVTSPKGVGAAFANAGADADAAGVELIFFGFDFPPAMPPKGVGAAFWRKCQRR